MSSTFGVSFQLVPKLDSGNYDTWKTKMEMLLIREKLWAIVCRRKLRPEGGTDDKPTKAQIEWDDEAERATATIFLYLGNMAERYVYALRDPVAIWEKLAEAYSTRGFSARSLIWRRLFSIRLDGHSGMEAYIDDIRDCCLQLKGAGYAVPEEVQASVLLNRLGETYEVFTSSISQYYRRDEKVNIDELTAQLIDEQRRKVAIEVPNAYLTRNTRGRDSRKPVCRHCHKPGHKEGNCWTKYPEKQSQDKVESF